MISRRRASRNTFPKVGLILAAVLAFSGLAAAGASASQPQFEGFPVTFSGAQVGTTELTSFSSISCKGGSLGGEFSTSTTIQGMQLRYTGCTEPLFGTPCTTAGAASGEIRTQALSGKTAYVEPGNSDVGIVLKPESGTSFASFTCAISGAHNVTGEMVCRVGPMPTLKSTGELSCVKFGNKQELTSYLNPVGCGTVPGVTLKDGLSAAAIGGTSKLTFSRAIKLNASKCV